jgi:DNA-binding transcriptional MerR regulator
MYDILSDIRQYNTALTISQLMKFCEKKGLAITRPMVQNYIRMGLLPPPVDRRFYTHSHIAALTIIEHLKNVYEIDEIKDALLPLMRRDGLALEIYARLFNERGALINEWEGKIRPLAVKAGEPDFTKLLLMSHAADVKRGNEGIE